MQRACWEPGAEGAPSLLHSSFLCGGNKTGEKHSFTHSTNTLDDRVVLKLGSHACREALENTEDKAGPMSLLDVTMLLLDSRD